MKNRDTEASYTAIDQMVFSAACEIKDDDIIYVGVGLPMLATLLAKHTHAPNCVVVLENGIIRSDLFPLPMGTDTLGTQSLANQLNSLAYVNNLGQAGYINLGFLGAGQVDRYGNVNDTVIGDYYKPIHRWPGSGGGNDVMSFCTRTIVMIRQSKQRFPEKVDFNTCPGYLDGKPGQREKAGLPPNTGPGTVISNLGTYVFEDGEMNLKSFHGGVGVTVDQVKAEVSWDLKMSSDLKETEPPSEEYLRVYREKVDPEGAWAGGKRILTPQPEK